MTPANYKAFLYARRSSDESSDRQLQSIDDQINCLKPLAARLGIKIVEVIAESKSSKQPYIRPKFENMLERMEGGEADGILTYHINRLSRNPIDSGRLSWMLQKGIIKAIQTMDREYLPQDNVLLFNVETSMANQFIRDLAVVSRRGMQSKADKGWMPSRCPLGYYNDPLTNEIYPDKKRWDLVRKMWDLLLTGNYTVPQIRHQANEDWGFRTPKTKRMGGGPVALSTMYRMFTNQFYTGIFGWSNGVYTGNHKAMIAVEEFDRAQVILGRKGKPRHQTHESSYTGIITCGECGSMCTCTLKNKIVKKTGKLTTYGYYHCTKKKRDESNKAICKQVPVTLDELEKQIDIKLERYTIHPKFREWAIEILNRDNDKEIQERTKIYESQQEAYSKTQRELDTLTQMRYRNLIDDEEFIRERERLKGQLQKLKVLLTQTENRAATWLELTEKTFNFACYARAKFINGNIQEKREMFTALGQNFSLKDKKVSIEANEWFIPIEKAYPPLKAEFDRLELDKKLSTEMRNEKIASLILTWGG